jgi:hypothetical protein
MRRTRLQVAGFSGTNDNEPLMPLTVKCMPSENLHIQATDGRMVCTLARSGKCIVTPLINTHGLSKSEQEPVWSRLLDLAIEQKVHALIDAGEHSMQRLGLLCCVFVVTFTIHITLQCS